jgi:hypothetical protein
MKMNKLGYFFEFLLFPPLVLLATLLAVRSSNPPKPKPPPPRPPRPPAPPPMNACAYQKAYRYWLGEDFRVDKCRLQSLRQNARFCG